MAISDACAYLNGTVWDPPPYNTKSAISWLVPHNQTLLSSIEKCCGGPAHPLQFYENNCLAWCETDEDWNSVTACVQQIHFSSGVRAYAHIGSRSEGDAVDNNNAIMFPEEPDPPFAWKEVKLPFKSCHQTRNLKIDYCVTMTEEELEKRLELEEDGKFDLEIAFLRVKMLAEACAGEEKRKERMLREARGWSRGWIFRPNGTKMHEVNQLRMKNCRLLQDLESRIDDLARSRRKPKWITFIVFTIIFTKIVKLW